VGPPTRLAVVGIDKELVGQMAAGPLDPEAKPYKGKGVGTQTAGPSQDLRAGKIGGKSNPMTNEERVR
jgi:hypothetical protein